MEQTNIRKQRHEARILWLIEHKSLWEGFPQSRTEFTPGSPDSKSWHAKWKSIVLQMQEEGFVSKTTYWPDYNLITNIGKARQRIREQNG